MDGIDNSPKDEGGNTGEGEGQVVSSEPPLPVIDHADDEASIEEEEDRLEGDILPPQDPAAMLEKLMMNEEEFKSYIKPTYQSSRNIRDAVNDESTLQDEDHDLLYDIVAKAGASIFMETDDPISEQALNVLKCMKLSMYIVRMELIEQAEKIKKLLFSYSGLNSLPVIFINGHLIGGYESLWFVYYTNLVSYIINKGRQTSFIGNFAFEYELIVIGGGPAGISAALESAKLGKRVALINYVAPSARGRAWGLGGTYINAGSISKNLMYAASSYVYAFGGHGNTKTKKGTPNWQKLVNNICENVKSITFSLRSKLKEAGCEYINGRAKFATDHTIEVSFPKTGEKRLMTSTVIIIATGSRPRYPKYIQGALEHCCTTDDFFWSAKPPGKTLILAATHIGLECATIIANFNYPVTVLVTPLIGKDIDWEIMRRAKSHMENIKIRFLEELIIDSVESVTLSANRNGLKVKGLSAKGIPFEEHFDTVLMEFGRVPNTSHLGLCRIGIEVHFRSRKIIVDDEGRTNRKHIFALGDIVHGWPELATVAMKAGKALVERLYKAYIRYVDLSFVPERVLFPVEYARIGKTEQAARMLFGDKVKSYEADSHVLGTLSSSPMRAYFYMKIICLQREKEEEVIAVHMLCHKAAEIIQGLAISLRKGVCRQDFEDMIALHPIFSEVVSNMKIRCLRTPHDVYKAAHKAKVKKAALKAIQAVQPFTGTKCQTVDKNLSEEQEVEEVREESSKELECNKNKGPRISKSMEKFIIEVIIKGKDVYPEAEEDVKENKRSESGESLDEGSTSSSTSDESDSSFSEEEETGSEVTEISEDSEGESEETEGSQTPIVSSDRLAEDTKSGSVGSRSLGSSNVPNEENVEKETADEASLKSEEVEDVTEEDKINEEESERH